MEVIGEYNKIKIKFGNDLINLTNMWKACKGTKNQKPAHWLQRIDIQKFMKSLEKKLKGTSHVPFKTIKGRNGGTYAHWQIGLAYAQYLDPFFHFWCNERIKEHFEMEANPELGVDKYTQKLIKGYKEAGKTDAWITDRFNGKIQHKLLVHALKKAGVHEYWTVMSEINMAVLGLHSKEFKKKKACRYTRDGMSSLQLNATALAQSMIEHEITTIKGNDEVITATKNTLRPMAVLMAQYHEK